MSLTVPLRSDITSFVFLCVVGVDAVGGSTVTSVVPDEQRLYVDLMSWYESSVRPVVNASTVINVRFKLSLNQIVDLVNIIINTHVQ